MVGTGTSREGGAGPASADRAARARAALALAERRTGARSVRLPGPLGAPGGGGAQRAEVGVAAGSQPPASPSALADLERPPLPVPSELERLLGAGLRRGSTVAVLGSTSLALALIAPASARGSWAGIVGQPSIGLLAAAEAGVVLERLALVPRPGADAAGVVAALLDGMDVVLVGPEAGILDADRRRLVARARERGSVLVSTSPWPGATVSLGVRTLGWNGTGEGEGRLRSLDVQVVRSGRGAAGHRLSVDLTLPLAPPGTADVTHRSAAQATSGTPHQGAPLRLVG